MGYENKFITDDTGYADHCLINTILTIHMVNNDTIWLMMVFMWAPLMVNTDHSWLTLTNE